MDPATPVKTIKAPPWLARALTPFMARHIAAQLHKEHPDWTRDQAEVHLRTNLGHAPDAAELDIIDQVLVRWPDRGRTSGARSTPGDSKAIDWRSPSVWVLVVANLVPLYGVLALDWGVFPLLLLFWLENVIIGLMTVARMLSLDPADGVSWAGKLFMVPFFCVHYGMFTSAHGIFVFSFFGGESAGTIGGGEWSATLDAALQALADYGLGWQIAAIGVSHVFSYLWNYIGHGEFRRTSLTELTRAPYGRIVVLHIALLIGGFAALALQSPIWALVLLVVLKIALDVRAHIKEHARLVAPHRAAPHRGAPPPTP